MTEKKAKCECAAAILDFMTTTDMEIEGIKLAAKEGRGFYSEDDKFFMSKGLVRPAKVIFEIEGKYMPQAFEEPDLVELLETVETFCTLDLGTAKKKMKDARMAYGKAEIKEPEFVDQLFDIHSIVGNLVFDCAEGEGANGALVEGE